MICPIGGIWRLRHYYDTEGGFVFFVYMEKLGFEICENVEMTAGWGQAGGHFLFCEVCFIHWMGEDFRLYGR